MKAVFTILLFTFCLHSFAQDVFDAARTGNQDLLDSLYKINSDTLNRVDENGFTPLILATYRNQTNTVEYLINKGVDIDYNSHEGTALHAACYKGNFSIAEMLIDAKASINLVGGRGATPLIYAVMSKNLKLVNFLIKKGALKETLDDRGMSALDYAIKMKNTDIQKSLN